MLASRKLANRWIDDSSPRQLDSCKTLWLHMQNTFLLLRGFTNMVARLHLRNRISDHAACCTYRSDLAPEWKDIL